MTKGEQEMISSRNQSIIDSFESIIKWVAALEDMDEAEWFKPIAEGKASTAEIMSHLLQWDQYLIANAVPDSLQGQGVVFPDFDPFNAEAYAYARSGVTKGQLIEQFRSTRTELCRLLESVGDEALERAITANGAALCPHTGTPYSLIYITEEFIAHDDHHKKQIDDVVGQHSNGMRGAL